MEQPSLPPLTRRELFKSVGVGIAAGTVALPLGTAANAAATELTGRPAGNAALSANEYRAVTGTEKLLGCTVAPAIEEAVCRAIPSIATDIASGFGSERALLAAIDGPEAAGLNRSTEQTRRSLICGAIGAIVSTFGFGFAHNATSEGYDQENIPAAALVCGSMFWGLQRRSGYRAPVLAHMTHNSLYTLVTHLFRGK